MEYGNDEAYSIGCRNIECLVFTNTNELSTKDKAIAVWNTRTNPTTIPSLDSDLPPVLDVCCGGRMMWFDKHDSRALFLDNRQGEWATDLGTPKTAGRSPIVVSPDIVADFTNIPYPDQSFSLVVFDPPHHTSKHFGSGPSIMQAHYGMLIPGWEEMLRDGFAECFRVLRCSGVLIFKWGSREIPLSRVLSLTSHRPLFGHQTTKQGTTHWVAFIKL